MHVKHNAPLSEYTSLRVGGKADKLIVLEPEEHLENVLTELGNTSAVWVLGYGTNCLISNEGLRGTVVINQAGGIERTSDDTIRVDSGVSWDSLVVAAIEAGLWGMEFTSGIPGGVGAAVAGDIAAYGQKVADTFVEARVQDTTSGEITTWKPQDLRFGYRTSSLQEQQNRDKIVLSATFKLSKEPTGELEYASALKVAEELSLMPDTLTNRRKIILETRARAGSILYDTTIGPWTAGSFFKNPLVNEDQVQAIIKHDESGISREQLLRQNQIHGGDHVRVSAAHVLLAAGFERGQSWGKVRLHPDHILKIENTGGATAQQIYDVVQEIITTVREKLSINLEPEVKIIGNFT